MPRTRVKFCGITNAEDAGHAVDSGADALGFNFFRGSSRYISPEAAREIASRLPAFVTTVALFVNEDPEDRNRIVELVQPDLLQFHGLEMPDDCRASGRPYIKALPVTEALAQQAADYRDASGILLDTQVDGRFGGTGETFDWSLVPPLSMPVILAGGLDAGNVGEAIRTLRPYAVDVSSGVEKAAGRKDKDKMQQFCVAVRAADQESL